LSPFSPRAGRRWRAAPDEGPRAWRCPRMPHQRQTPRRARSLEADVPGRKAPFIRLRHLLPACGEKEKDICPARGEKEKIPASLAGRRKRYLPRSRGEGKDTRSACGEFTHSLLPASGGITLSLLPASGGITLSLLPASGGITLSLLPASGEK